MLIMLKMTYSALIRPGEIRLLKIRDIDMMNKCIIVPSNVAKNGKHRIVAMTEDLYNEFITMEINEYPDNYFLFTEKFQPGKSSVGDHYYSNCWALIRKN